MCINPPVALCFPRANLSFIKSFHSFDIAIVYEKLLKHVTDNMLTVEVWEELKDESAVIIGLAEVCVF